MIDNQELPIGFTMELAMHMDIMKTFAAMPKERQEAIVEGARQIKSREEMKSYVESITG